jgi:hypothetical protein
VKGTARFSWRMVQDARFRRVFAVAVVLHMSWDSDSLLAGDLLFLLVGLAGWFMVASLIQEGLEEIRLEQRRH